jgi:hypothetical protein
MSFEQIFSTSTKMYIDVYKWLLEIQIQTKGMNNKI